MNAMYKKQLKGRSTRPKPASHGAHTFRHSFAGHLLQANHDIRAVQELSGHGDVGLTLMYAHTIKRIIRDAKSQFYF
jgi:site-specific recombinase XerD